MPSLAIVLRIALLSKGPRSSYLRFKPTTSGLPAQIHSFTTQPHHLCFSFLKTLQPNQNEAGAEYSLCYNKMSVWGQAVSHWELNGSLVTSCASYWFAASNIKLSVVVKAVVLWQLSYLLIKMAIYLYYEVKTGFLIVTSYTYALKLLAECIFVFLCWPFCFWLCLSKKSAINCTYVSHDPWFATC